MEKSTTKKIGTQRCQKKKLLYNSLLSTNHRPNKIRNGSTVIHPSLPPPSNDTTLSTFLKNFSFPHITVLTRESALWTLRRRRGLL